MFCCVVLYCVVLHRVVLYCVCVVLCRSVLWCVASGCTVLCCVVFGLDR